MSSCGKKKNLEILQCVDNSSLLQFVYGEPELEVQFETLRLKEILFHLNLRPAQAHQNKRTFQLKSSSKKKEEEKEGRLANH